MKILVSIYIPGISEKQDIWLPKSLRIGDAVSMIAKTIEELSNHRYSVSGEECLCSADKNLLLKKESTLEDYGIKNGDLLVMM